MDIPGESKGSRLQAPAFDKEVIPCQEMDEGHSDVLQCIGDGGMEAGKSVHWVFLVLRSCRGSNVTVTAPNNKPSSGDYPHPGRW